MKTDKKKSTVSNDPAQLDTCTNAPEFAEHARPNESPREPCDDGRAGFSTFENHTKEVNDMTSEKQKNEQCEDIVKKRKEERQHTMDKMSVDTSEAHTYDKDSDDDSEKCS